MDALGQTTSQAPKTIVFCTTKNYCSKVYYCLSKGACDKHAVSMYHASLTQDTKSKVHDNFKCGAQLRCLSATVAFGMVNDFTQQNLTQSVRLLLLKGMDISDIELVMVYGIPDTVSQLYQV